MKAKRQVPFHMTQVVQHAQKGRRLATWCNQKKNRMNNKVTCSTILPLHVMSCHEHAPCIPMLFMYVFHVMYFTCMRLPCHELRSGRRSLRSLLFLQKLLSTQNSPKRP